jgi:hypothetical protein
MTDTVAVLILFLIYVVATQTERYLTAVRAREERITLARLALEERRALENRLIALTDRDASVLVNAQETFTGGDVTYVDERREWELDRDGDE